MLGLPSLPAETPADNPPLPFWQSEGEEESADRDFIDDAEVNDPPSLYAHYNGITSADEEVEAEYGLVLRRTPERPMFTPTASPASQRSAASYSRSPTSSRFGQF